MGREKVVSTLEEIKTQTAEIGLDSAVIAHKFIDKIIALLKEQEAIKPRVSCVEQRCGNCGKVIEMDGWKVCPWCGKPILWEAFGRSVK